MIMPEPVIQAEAVHLRLELEGELQVDFLLPVYVYQHLEDGGLLTFCHIL